MDLDPMRYLCSGLTALFCRFTSWGSCFLSWISGLRFNTLVLPFSLLESWDLFLTPTWGIILYCPLFCAKLLFWTCTTERLSELSSGQSSKQPPYFKWRDPKCNGNLMCCNSNFQYQTELLLSCLTDKLFFTINCAASEKNSNFYQRLCLKAFPLK